MPATSAKQRRAMAIAEHAPEKLYARNRGMKTMSKGQLHEFAATREKRLPKRSARSAAARRMAHKFHGGRP